MILYHLLRNESDKNEKKVLKKVLDQTENILYDIEVAEMTAAN